MSDAAGIVQLIGRILFVSFFVMSGLGFHVGKTKMAEGFARQMGFPFPAIAGWPTGVWMVAAAVSVALGIWPDVGVLMIAAFVFVAASYFHRFWTVEDPDQKMTQQQLFFRNVITLGAALVMFAFFVTLGEGLRYTITGPLFEL